MVESGWTSPRNELLSCKERSDDSSELRGAGDVGRDSILTMADAALPLPRRSMPRRFRFAHGFMSVYDVKPVCAIRCRIGSKAGCLIPTDIARLPCAGDVDGDVPALRWLHIRLRWNPGDPDPVSRPHVSIWKDPDLLDD